MLNEEDLVQIFDIDGLLSHCIDKFEYREDQLSIAKDVLYCYKNNAIGAIEAGTGIGKSFSYLVPALFFAFEDSEDRTVIATSTINLQKQLLEKDLPALLKMFNTDCKVALAVGRNNYICLRRLSEQLNSIALFKDDDNSEIVKLNRFANSTESGLRTDYPYKLDLSVWNSVCSDGDFCLGGKCPYFSQCFYFKAKKELNSASIIVCNHHLLFVDSNSRLETGSTYDDEAVLPSFRHLVIDEAHNIERHATNLFTTEYSSYVLRRQMDYVYDPKLNVSGIPRMLDELARCCSDKTLYDDIVNLFTIVNSNAETINMVLLNRMGYAKISHILLSQLNVMKVLSDSIAVIKNLMDNVSKLLSKLSVFSSKITVDESIKYKVDELNIHIGRIKSIISVLTDFTEPDKWNNDVRFLEIVKHGQYQYVTFKIAPLDVSAVLRDALFSKIDSVVCTSATLDLNDDFTYWRSAVGIPVPKKGFLKKVYRSPFDYRNRLMLLTPYNAPDFDKDKPQEYADYLTSTIYDAVSSSDGGSLILFTSIKIMEYVYGNLSPRFETLGYRCLKQGDRDRYSLLEEFKKDTNSVLFATDSFWEGVDAPGNTLRLVVITKLPFRMPDEPIYKARLANLEKEGKSGFFCLSLPDATMKLKQGFGRLMRHTTDKGIVLILDSRIVNRQYGALMLSSLPESYHPETAVETLNQKIESFLF